MIALGNATTTLTATLSGAKNTNDAAVTVFFTDEPSSPSGVAVAVYDKQQSTTNGVTPVTICAAGPGGVGIRRRVKSINIFNADLASITVAIKIVDSSGPTTTTLQQITLATLEQLNYEEGYGFEALDVNGAIKSQAAATSSATSTAQLLATSAWSVLTQINAPASVLSTSVQASSLAAAIVPASINSVSSQASSMAAQNPNTVSSLQSAASVQSFTSTNWATVSSATSRVKSSFSW